MIYLRGWLVRVEASRSGGLQQGGLWRILASSENEYINGGNRTTHRSHMYTCMKIVTTPVDIMGYNAHRLEEATSTCHKVEFHNLKTSLQGCTKLTAYRVREYSKHRSCNMHPTGSTASVPVGVISCLP